MILEDGDVRTEVVEIWAWETSHYERLGYTVQWTAGWQSLFGLWRRAVKSF